MLPDDMQHQLRGETELTTSQGGFCDDKSVQNIPLGKPGNRVLIWQDISDFCPKMRNFFFLLAECKVSSSVSWNTKFVFFLKSKNRSNEELTVLGIKCSSLTCFSLQRGMTQPKHTNQRLYLLHPSL